MSQFDKNHHSNSTLASISLIQIKNMHHGYSNKLFIRSNFLIFTTYTYHACITCQTPTKRIKLDQGASVLVRQKFTSKRKQEPPLPESYQVPQNYQPEIQEGLQKRRLLGINRTKFITAIAESIHAFKRTPTHDEYQRVALQIVKKWSFLGRNNGHVSTLCTNRT